MHQSTLNKIGGGNPVFPINLSGRSLPVLQFLIMLDETWPMETDKDWWTLYLATKWWN